MAFKIHIELLEIRFANSFVYWDKAGAIAGRVLEKHPNLEVRRANTDSVVLRCPQTELEFSYSFKDAKIHIPLGQSSKSRLAELSDYFFETVTEALEVKSISRIGHVQCNERRYSKKSELLDDMGRVNAALGIGPCPLLMVGGPFVDAQTESSRRSDTTAKLGLNTTVHAREVEAVVSGPFASMLQDRLPPAYQELRVDLDWYTKRPLPVDDFKASNLVGSNQQLFDTLILNPISRELRYGQ